MIDFDTPRSKAGLDNVKNSVRSMLLTSNAFPTPDQTYALVDSKFKEFKPEGTDPARVKMVCGTDTPSNTNDVFLDDQPFQP
jgi:hypothetical protein